MFGREDYRTCKVGQNNNSLHDSLANRLSLCIGLNATIVQTQFRRFVTSGNRRLKTTSASMSRLRKYSSLPCT